jgi:Uma2 family endonuclease
VNEPIFAVMVPTQSDGGGEWQTPEIPVWFDSEAAARAWARSWAADHTGIARVYRCQAIFDTERSMAAEVIETVRPTTPIMAYSARVPIIATDEDVLRTTADNPGWKVERDANGQLTMSPAGGQSSRRNSRLTRMLDEWAQRYDFASFDSSCGFHLPDSSIVSPAGALVPLERWRALKEEEREGFLPIVPTVAIELCSITDDPRDLRRKLESIKNAGASYVVLIDAYRNAIWEDGARPSHFDLDFTTLLSDT